MLAHLLPPGRATDPSPGPRRLVEAPDAVHPVPLGVCVITRVCVSFRGAAGDEESRIVLKTLGARFLAPLGMTAWRDFRQPASPRHLAPGAWNLRFPLYAEGGPVYIIGLREIETEVR